MVSLLRRWPVFWLFVYWVGIFTMTHIPMPPSPDFGFSWVDKTVHFMFYIVLGHLIVNAQVFGKGRGYWFNLYAGCGLGLVYSYVDEYVQGLEIVGRHFSYWDIAADCWGILTCFLLYYCQGWYWRNRRGWLVCSRVAGVLIAVLLLCGSVLPQQYFLHLINGIRGLGLIDFDDKGAHYFAALFLTFFVAMSKPLSGKYERFNGVVGVVFLVGVGFGFEFVQRLAPGRASDWADVTAHMVGVVQGVVIWVVGAIVTGTIRHETLRSGWDLPADVRHDGVIGEVGDDDGFIGRAMLVSGLTLLSRMMGLVRDAVLVGYFDKHLSDAFYMGFKVPNLFRRLFGEGALTAAFIPEYTGLLKEDRDKARRVASVCIGLMLGATGLLTILGEGILIYMRGFDDFYASNGLVIDLTMLMLPYMPLVCLVAVLGGILQVHRKFGAPAFAPVLLNGVMILTCLVFVSGLEGDTQIREGLMILGGSILFAGCVQVIWQVGAMMRVERLVFDFGGTGGSVRRIWGQMLPMMVGLAVFQVNVMCDALIAYSLSPKAGGGDTFGFMGGVYEYPIGESGAVTSLELAQRLYQFPLGVFGIAIATAIFPALSAAAAGVVGGWGDVEGRFVGILRRGLRMSFFIGLPSTVGVMMVGFMLTRVIFEWGVFDTGDAERVTGALLGYASAIWAYSLAHVLTRGFYAQKDARTPMRVSLVMVVLNLVLNLTFVWWMGEVAIAWSTAFCAVVQMVVLLWIISKRTGGHLWDGDMRRSVGQSVGISLLMAAVLGMLHIWFDVGEMSWMGCLVLLMVTVCLGGGVYFAGARVLGMAELRWLLRRRLD